MKLNLTVLCIAAKKEPLSHLRRWETSSGICGAVGRVREEREEGVGGRGGREEGGEDGGRGRGRESKTERVNL